MKKLFSLLLALVLVSSSFSVAFAEESTSRSAEEIRAEMQKVREELKKETLKNRISTRSAEVLSTEEIIERESIALPLKNKLADLDYELAKLEGRVIDKDDLLKSLSTAKQTRSFDYNGVNLQPGDILLFYTDSSSSSFYYNSIEAGIFNRLTHGWGYAILVLDNGEGLHIWAGVNSQRISISSALQNIDYSKLIVKKIDTSNIEKKLITSYTDSILLNKPYPSAVSIFSGWHSKRNISQLYCSQGPWLAYMFAKNIDIDDDGGPAVYPVDILNSQYGIHYAIHTR